LLVQREVTKRKHARVAHRAYTARSPARLASAGRSPNSPGAEKRASGSIRSLATAPGLAQCSVRDTGGEQPTSDRYVEVFSTPRMAHPSTAWLGASARRGADRDVCACPAATGCRVGAARDPKPRSVGQCAIRGRVSLVTFFARAKKVTRPRCGNRNLLRGRRPLIKKESKKFTNITFLTSDRTHRARRLRKDWPPAPGQT
jgi:hypothetical protein